MEFKGTKGIFSTANPSKSDLTKLYTHQVRFVPEGSAQLNTFLHSIAYGETPEEVEANAKLIAAAPDLLEATENLIELLSFHGYSNATEIYKAKAAINKAVS